MEHRPSTTVFQAAAAAAILINMSWLAAPRLIAGADALPLPWNWVEIGSPQKRGSASWVSGKFVITAAGADIAGSADQFGFVYQTLDGDGEIVAHLGDLLKTHPWAKAGLMFRDEMTRDAKYAAAFVTPDKGLLFQYRIAAGAASSQIAAGSGRPPQWLRLSRKGQTFTASASSNGSTWTTIGSEVVYLNRLVYVGLAVTSRSTRALTSASFTNLTVTTGPTVPTDPTDPTEPTPPVSNSAPQVAITSPSPGSGYTAPCEIEISAAAADPDGTIARVDFYAGSNLIASDSSGPYSVRWSDVPAGTHTLTAVARDNNGAATTSGAVAITVSAAIPLPSLVVFNASADHDTTVLGYTVEFFTSGSDPESSAPIRILEVGKPAPVNGEIAVDVAGTVQGLPAGIYFSTVSASGSGGSSRSAPSEVFVR
jgi:hypothetical protein